MFQSTIFTSLLMVVPSGSRELYMILTQEQTPIIPDTNSMGICLHRCFNNIRQIALIYYTPLVSIINCYHKNPTENFKLCCFGSEKNQQNINNEDINIP